MPYETKCDTITIGSRSFEITSLKDRSQFYDPDNEAEKMGISSSMWPISGLIWPAGIVLAELINSLDLGGLRLLEVGCGIAIPSIIAASKNANITASDYHPITHSFLAANVAANNLKAIKYIAANWEHPISNHGKYDLIIGSDLLYERNHSDFLSRFIDCHLSELGKVILVDPGRPRAGKIKRAMNDLNFHVESSKLKHTDPGMKISLFNQYVFTRDNSA